MCPFPRYHIRLGWNSRKRISIPEVALLPLSACGHRSVSVLMFFSFLNNAGDHSSHPGRRTDYKKYEHN